MSTALFPSALGCPQDFGPKSGRLRWGSGLESQTPGSFWTQNHPSKRSLQRGLPGGGGLGAGRWCLRLQRGPGLGRYSARRRAGGTGRAHVVPPGLTQPALPCPLGQRPQGSPGTPSRRLVQKLWGDSVLGEDAGCIQRSPSPAPSAPEAPKWRCPQWRSGGGSWDDATPASVGPRTPGGSGWGDSSGLRKLARGEGWAPPGPPQDLLAQQTPPRTPQSSSPIPLS